MPETNWIMKTGYCLSISRNAAVLLVSLMIALAGSGQNTTNGSNGKHPADPNFRLKLTAYASSDNTYQETVIGFDNNATDEYDLNFDSHFFPGIAGAPVMYSVTPSLAQLSTNIMPFHMASVPVYFQKGNASDYTMIATNVESFAGDGSIILEDLITGTTQDLRLDHDYNFASASGDPIWRFIVHFSGFTGVPEKQDRPITVFSREKIISILNPEGIKIRDVSIHDLHGKELFHRVKVKDKLLKIDMSSIQTGYYMVRISFGRESFTRKVVVN